MPLMPGLSYVRTSRLRMEMNTLLKLSYPLPPADTKMAAAPVGSRLCNTTCEQFEQKLELAFPTVPNTCTHS